MLIDINLLPKKERRNPLFLPILVGFIAISLLGSLYIYYEYNNVTNHKEFTEQNLESARELRALVEAQLAEGEVSGAVNELERMISWIETVPVSSVQMMEHLTELLPLQGYFLSISYADSRVLTLSTQFSTIEQVSAYLYHMGQSTWIDAADIERVEAIEDEGRFQHYEADFTIELNVAALKAAEKEGE